MYAVPLKYSCARRRSSGACRISDIFTTPFTTPDMIIHMTHEDLSFCLFSILGEAKLLRDLQRNFVSLRFRNPLDFENSEKLRFLRIICFAKTRCGKYESEQEIHRKACQGDKRGYEGSRVPQSPRQVYQRD